MRSDDDDDLSDDDAWVSERGFRVWGQFDDGERVNGFMKMEVAYMTKMIDDADDCDADGDDECWR